MKHSLIMLAVALVAAPALAQPQAQPAAPPPAPPSAEASTRVSGSVTAGALLVDNSTNSANLTEYRDLKNTFDLPRVDFLAVKTASGLGVEAAAYNLVRDDRTVFARAGQPGVWTVQADWAGIPHNFSNKALTPYADKGGGVLTLTATVPITFKRRRMPAQSTQSRSRLESRSQMRKNRSWPARTNP